jgi:hypothetical protein
MRRADAPAAVRYHPTPTLASAVSPPPPPPPLPPHLRPDSSAVALVGQRSPLYRAPPSMFTVFADPYEATQMRQLHLVDCDTVHNVLSFSDQAQLELVHVKNCPHIKAHLDFSQCPQVQQIIFENCPELRGEITLPASEHLREVGFVGCPLITALPDVACCPGLEKLNFENVPVSHIPDSVFQLPPNAVVRLSLTQVSSEVLQKIHHQKTDPNYAGPQFEWAYENATSLIGGHRIPTLPFCGDPRVRQIMAQNAAEAILQRRFGPAHAAIPSVADQVPSASLFSNNFENHDMLEEVLQWRQMGDPSVGLNPVWRQLAQHKNAVYFATFLEKLQKSKNKPDRVAQVNRFLNQMQSQPELALRCLEKTVAQDGDCVDRSALILMELERECVQFNAELNAARYAKNPRQLLELGLGFHQMNLVSALAQEKVKTLENKIICGMTRGLTLLPQNTLDQVEVHMGYFSTLAPECKWPVKVAPMAFPDFANLTGMPATGRRKIMAHVRHGRQKIAELVRCQSAGMSAADRRDARTDIGRARLVLRQPENLLGGAAATRFLIMWDPVNKLLEMQNPATINQFKTEKKAQEKKIREAMEKLDPNAGDYKKKCEVLGAAFDEVGPALAEKYKGPLLASITASHQTSSLTPPE